MKTLALFLMTIIILIVFDEIDGMTKSLKTLSEQVLKMETKLNRKDLNACIKDAHVLCFYEKDPFGCIDVAEVDCEKWIEGKE